MITAVIILALVDLGFLALNIHLVKAIKNNRAERILLAQLKKYRSTKLGRLYSRAVYSNAPVIKFPSKELQELLVA
jgi:hypothetical protein